jgi:hypothetical protein
MFGPSAGARKCLRAYSVAIISPPSRKQICAGSTMRVMCVVSASRWASKPGNISATASGAASSNTSTSAVVRLTITVATMENTRHASSRCPVSQ